MEEEVPKNGGWDKDGKAEESARVAGESATGRKGTRRSEKAKVKSVRGGIINQEFKG